MPIFLAFIVLLCSTFPATSQTTPQKPVPPANYDEAKVGTYRLPDPLVFKDGKPVRTARDWAKRRPEILELFADNFFGRSAEARKIRYEVFDEDHHALGGKAIRRQVTIYFSGRKDFSGHKDKDSGRKDKDKDKDKDENKAGPTEDLLIYLPAQAKGPVPLILALNFNGNQAVVSDSAVRLPMVWNRQTHQPESATEASRGTDRQFEVEKVLERGYGFATIYYQQIEPDFPDGWKYGVRQLFLHRPPRDSEWGAIGAWSYGLSRAMDYLEHDNGVDSKRVAIMGHSRLGKTVLWAGALDVRFAMVIANCPGEGGASLVRRNYGETIANITSKFGYWFAPKLAEFGDRVEQLPVDMHELIALMAPRPVYVTGAVEDQWADPKGEFLACVAAGPVFRLLGAQDLGTDQMPEVNQPVIHTIAYHMRDGKHDVLPFDWEQYLKLMDMHFAPK
jgi:hypothetical protein